MELSQIKVNQPLYLYQCPMFMITVSTVLIVDNGVILVKENNDYKFPGGMVKAGQETVQFAAVKYVKEQTGIMLQKDLLIPIDFRSNPERSLEGNEVDIGFVCIIEHKEHKDHNGIWKEVDFEEKRLMEKEKLYMDHEILLERAIDWISILK